MQKMTTRGDPKKLKGAQIEKLRRIALDGRRDVTDRTWAASQLSDHGVEIGPNVIPGFATPGEGRRMLLGAKGGCISASEAIRRFRRPALSEEIRKRNVIVYGRGGLERILVPVWQFTTKGRILPGVPAVLKVLREIPGGDQLAPFAFCLQPEPMLRMRTPLEALRNGEVNQVLAAAIEHVRCFGGAKNENIETMPPAKLPALLRARGEAMNPSIEKLSGRSFSSVEVATRFGVTPGAVRSWVKDGRCVGYPDSRKRIRLPAWQFSNPKTICPWVALLIKAFGDNGWAFLHFVTVPRFSLAGESLLRRALAGDVEIALNAARRANPD